MVEEIIRAKTGDGSGMYVAIEAYNHDEPEMKYYRVVYGEENGYSSVYTFETLIDAVKAFNEYVAGEVMGYFGLDNL